MKIRQKILISNLLVLFFALLLMILTITSIRTINAHLSKQHQAGELIKSLINLSVLTEDVIVFQYERAWQQWEAEYERIKNILSVHDILPKSSAVPIDMLDEDLEKFKAMSDSDSDIITEEYSEIMSSHIRLKIRGIIADLYNVYDESTQEAARLLRVVAIQFGGYSFLFLFVLLTISIFLLRRFTKTFDILIRGAEKIIKGDLTASFDISYGKHRKSVDDEITDLAKAFNAMTTKLTRTLEELETEVDERIITGKNLEQALAEKDVLIQELYHRTKNNMQVIQSMLNLKVMQYGDVEMQNLIGDVQAKIYSMSLVHEKLYQSKNLNYIDLKDYFEDLILYIYRSYKIPGSPVEYELEISHLSVPMETAVPCGIAVSELIMNSFKHACTVEKTAIINFKLEKLEDEVVRISIADNGPGLPEGFKIADSNSLGLKTVQSLIESQIGGKLDYESNECGLFWTIVFKVNGRY